MDCKTGRSDQGVARETTRVRFKKLLCNKKTASQPGNGFAAGQQRCNCGMALQKGDSFATEEWL